jgi:hypothetical protein
VLFQGISGLLGSYVLVPGARCLWWKAALGSIEARELKEPPRLRQQSGGMARGKGDSPCKPILGQIRAPSQ